MIEKILALILILVYFFWSATAQSVAPMQSLKKEITPIENNEHPIKIHYSNKELRQIIMEVGEENGWIITEFKNNALIAEKIQKGDSVALTVKFNNSSFSLQPQNSELQELITAKLY